jgi:chromate transporter
VNVYLEIFEIMFRIGSLIFGGGQVVLPMLQDEVVPNWMTKDVFLQGLGLTQSMPGPLFNFSAYLGAVYRGIAGGLVAWVGIMGPGVILIFVSLLFVVVVPSFFFQPFNSFISPRPTGDGAVLVPSAARPVV